MKRLILCSVLFAVAGCAPMSDERASRALQASGLRDAQFDGIAFFGCDEKDFFRKKFTATNAAGQRVSGTVCGGFFKGATVRFD